MVAKKKESKSDAGQVFIESKSLFVSLSTEWNCVKCEVVNTS